MCESDSDECFMSQAFCVPEIPANFDPNQVPTSGEEYLQHAVYESRRAQQTVSVDVNSIKMKKTPTVPSDSAFSKTKTCKNVPDALLPPKEWQDKQIDEFVALENHIDKLKYINKYKINDKIHLEVLKKSFLKKDPTMQLITSFSQNTLIELLDYINANVLEPLIANFQIDKVPKHLHLWVFAIFSQLEIPYSPDLYAIIRDLAVNYSKIRLQMYQNGLATSCDDVKPINLIICLVLYYFKQLDLISNN